MSKGSKNWKAFDDYYGMKKVDPVVEALESKLGALVKERDEKIAAALHELETVQRLAGHLELKSSRAELKSERLKLKIARQKAEIESLREKNKKNAEIIEKACSVLGPALSEKQAASQPDNDSELCVICLESKKVLAIVPCGHVVSCDGCKEKLTQCPVCRGGKNAVFKVFY